MAETLLIQHQYYYYAIAPLLLYLTYKLYVRATLRLPPGPRSWPIVGSLYDLKPVRFQCFSEWAERYGPIISFRLGADLNVVVSSAELAREVLKEKDEQLADRCGSRREGTGLAWADYGPHFVKVRKVCSLELLSSKRLEALRSIREEEVNAMVESIYNNSINLESRGEGSLVVRKYLGAVALNTMTRLAFGKRFESSELIEVVVGNGPKLEEESLAFVEHIPLLRWMLRSNKKDDAHGARRDASIRAIMEERVGKPNQQHFVDALSALDKHEHQLTHDTIVALLRDMMTGGVDTIAVSVEWAMAELMRNPRIQKKAQAELDRGIGSDRVMTEWDFSNLPYLRCIVKEALRLHPPTPLMLPHRARARVRVGGYDIPKGSTVHVNVWAIARDPAHWRNPLEFRPERFMEEDVDLKGHDFRLLPFGAGRRACPGAQLAMNLVTSILGHLLHHFNWTAPDGLMPGDIDVSEAPGIVASMSTPLQAIPVPRLPPHLYKRSQTLDDMDFHI